MPLNQNLPSIAIGSLNSIPEAPARTTVVHVTAPRRNSRRENHVSAGASVRTAGPSRCPLPDGTFFFFLPCLPEDRFRSAGGGVE
jgi:hypothetical protein